MLAVFVPRDRFSLPAQIVGAGVLPEGVGWPEAFFWRHPIHRPVAVQLAVKAQQVAVDGQVHERVVGACEQLGICGADKFHIHRTGVGGVKVPERPNGRAIKTPAVHGLVGRVSAMKQTQIQAGLAGANAINRRGAWVYCGVHVASM